MKSIPLSLLALVALLTVPCQSTPRCLPITRKICPGPVELLG